MFASHLLGRVINGLRPVSASSQPIELEPGQVFRGVIVKAFPNQMVQVQLSGTTIYAQLNAPLEVGQQAWLQVLPKSNPITLKVIDTSRSSFGTTISSGETADKSAMESLLRGIGIKVDRTNIQNLQLLVDSNISLKTEQLGSMLDLLRASNNPDRTIQLIQLAHQRGLPVTNEVVRSLDATLFGRSLGDIMNQLNQHMHENRQATPLIQHANQLWQQARNALSTIISPQALASIPNSNTSNSLINQPFVVPSTQQVQGTPPATGSLTTHTTSQVASQIALATNLNAEQLSTRTLVNSQTPAVQMLNTDQESNHIRSTTEAVGEQRATAAQAAQEKGLSTFFRLLGIDYEHSILSKNNLANEVNPAVKSDQLQQLKGILLELRGMDHLSTSFRETIDQGIRMVTGQQLLLVNDGNAPWSSFIFHIPLPHMQKTEPSFIHIEGRKKGREVIDHENCRLLFHLDLDALDQTMIDIQITNRIMSIQIYNNMPWLKEWIDESREEWITAMQGHEYHLSNIKVQPIPRPEQQISTPLPVQQSSYRGVDLRV